MTRRLTSILRLFLASLATANSAHAAEIDLLHLWRTESEQAALAVFADAARARGVIWHDIDVLGGADGLQTEFTKLLSAGIQPSVVQWIVSSDIKRMFETQVFRRIDGIGAEYADSLTPDVRDIVFDENGLTVVPVGIHTYNSIIYNKSLLEEFGLEPATTWEELLSYGPILAEKNIDLIATSSEPWQLRALATPILASFLTRDEYLAVALGNETLATYRDEVIRTFEIIEELRKFSNYDEKELRWEEVVERVADGRALFQILGDYAISQYPDEDNIVCSLVPGTKFMLWGMDSFAFSVSDDPEVRAGQDIFVEILSDPENAVRYIERKGGVPVLAAIHPSKLRGCDKFLLQQWLTHEHLWTGLNTIQAKLAALGSIIAEAWNEPGDSAAIKADRLIEVFDSL